MNQHETKCAFVAKLRALIAADLAGVRDEPIAYTSSYGSHRLSRNDRVLLPMLADYFECAKATVDPQGEPSWFFDLPQRLVIAFAAFRTDATYAASRARYAEATHGEQIPDLVSVEVCPLHRILVIYNLGRLLYALSGELWVKHAFDAYVRAQDHVITQAWCAFARVAFPALALHLEANPHAANAARFGATQLFVMSVMNRATGAVRQFCIGFKRDGTPDTTFVVDAADPTGLSAGPAFFRVPFTTCVAMLEEVTAQWDLARLAQVPTDAVTWMQR